MTTPTLSASHPAARANLHRAQGEPLRGGGEHLRAFAPKGAATARVGSRGGGGSGARRGRRDRDGRGCGGWHVESASGLRDRLQLLRPARAVPPPLGKEQRRDLCGGASRTAVRPVVAALQGLAPAERVALKVLVRGLAADPELLARNGDREWSAWARVTKRRISGIEVTLCHGMMPLGVTDHPGLGVTYLSDRTKNGPGTGPGQTYTWTHDQVYQRSIGTVVIVIPAPGTPGGPQ